LTVLLRPRGHALRACSSWAEFYLPHERFCFRQRHGDGRSARRPPTEANSSKDGQKFCEFENTTGIRHAFVRIGKIRGFFDLKRTTMMRQISKFLFPHLPRDQQRRRMNMIVATLLVALIVGGTVAVAIYLTNRR
jgi:hypothetical protein